VPSDPHVARFEVLPTRGAVHQAAELPAPAHLTVTCSPRQGPDGSVAVGGELAALGHTVTVHVAARLVRDRAHVDRLLGDMAAAGIEDLFLIGGDAGRPEGPYASAGELLPVVRDHPHAPRTVGIAGYPEGHPKIDPATLADALVAKAPLADYVTTQMCFDPDAVRSWSDGIRERGVTLPVLIGTPGAVDRIRLVKMALRLGIGASLGFLRKQRGLWHLLGLGRPARDRVHDELEACLTDPEGNLVGFHYYTFNQLGDTWRWERERTAARRPNPVNHDEEESLRT
jgi:methylenetetrahydrofolate reductase (NADPH)